MTVPIEQLDEQSLRTLFADHFNAPVDRWIPLRGDGSDRQIIRMGSGTKSCIGIIGPNIEENRAFLGFTRNFASVGLPVPAVFAVHPSGRMYIEEDLGDTTLAAWQEEQRDGNAFSVPVREMYEEVLRTLVRFQIDAADAVDYSLCYQYGEFGHDSMLADIAYFRTMFLGNFYKGRITEMLFERDAGAFVEELLHEPRKYFLYRDFQSRNIMITADGPRFIDYQSGRRGALQYDVASLLYDSRGNLTPEVRRDLLQAYLDEVMLRVDVDVEQFVMRFDGFAILRLLQALGAFGKLGVINKKVFFLPLIPSRLYNLGALVGGSSVMNRAPYLRDLLMEICEYPAALSLPEVEV